MRIRVFPQNGANDFRSQWAQKHVGLLEASVFVPLFHVQKVKLQLHVPNLMSARLYFLAEVQCDLTFSSESMNACCTCISVLLLWEDFLHDGIIGGRILSAVITSNHVLPLPSGEGSKKQNCSGEKSNQEDGWRKTRSHIWVIDRGKHTLYWLFRFMNKRNMNYPHTRISSGAERKFCRNIFFCFFRCIYNLQSCEIEKSQFLLLRWLLYP